MARVVTIDGPAGSGKSTVARELAKRLGWRFLDTGAMYRCVALAALRAGVSIDDPEALGKLAASLNVAFDFPALWIDGVDVTDSIRTPEINAASSRVAAAPPVRAVLREWQRAFAEGHDTVTEGRDQGTAVFPHATCKFFLTASPHVRAQRRHAELQRKNPQIAFDDILRDQQERDERDANRPDDPLRMADDAIEVDTSQLDAPQVLAHLESLVRRRLSETR